MIAAWLVAICSSVVFGACAALAPESMVVVAPVFAVVIIGAWVVIGRGDPRWWR